MKKPVWKTKDPTKTDKKLTSGQKASAKAATCKQLLQVRQEGG
jgi:hypothetical protein